jgi:hypothetical protein
LLAQVRSLLRELPLGTLPPPPELERSLLIINRNVCQKVREGECHAGREVSQQAGILAALKEAFPDREIIDAKGAGPLVEQAAQFRRAAIVAGPYGAGLNNMYFCPDHTSIVEFVAANRTNIFVFSAYAHIHGFPYWVVVSPGRDYNGIMPRAVVDTIEHSRLCTFPPSMPRIAVSLSTTPTSCATGTANLLPTTPPAGPAAPALTSVQHQLESAGDD